MPGRAAKLSASRFNSSGYFLIILYLPTFPILLGNLTVHQIGQVEFARLRDCRYHWRHYRMSYRHILALQE